MKISVCSDLHLEFGPISLQNNDNADVLVLSGDICIAKEVIERDTLNLRGENDRSNQYHTFFQECCERFPHVIYIMGNHEHYHGDYATSVGNLRNHLGYLDNLYILDKETFALDGVTFIGGTLWTDMNKEDPLTLHGIRGYMNDYRTVNNSANVKHYRDSDGNKHISIAKLLPEDTVADHKAMLEFIDKTVAAWPWAKFVVVGHHAPSKLSTKPRYENDVMVNGAYSSDLSEFILNHPQIKLWTHGHTHHEFDYMIGETRILCNPRGYINYEDQADHFKLKTVEV